MTRAPKERAVQVHVTGQDGEALICPQCDVGCPRYDHRRRHWRHLDRCAYRTRIGADLPRVERKLRRPGVRVSEAPGQGRGAGDHLARVAQGKPPAKAELGRPLVQPKESRTRARGAPPLGVIKPLWGYRKTRYQGLKKNAAPVYTLLARAHFYRARQSLIAVPGSV